MNSGVRLEQTSPVIVRVGFSFKMRVGCMRWQPLEELTLAKIEHHTEAA